MNQSILFAPLVPLPILIALALVTICLIAFAIWRRLPGWALRGLAGLLLIAAIANPSLQTEDRTPLSDIIIAVVDQSASQRIADRPDQTAAALDHLRAEIARSPGTELHVVDLADSENDNGTEAMTALTQALAEQPLARIAGIVMISDGRVHDLDLTPPMPAPLHLLMTGHDSDWDRRLIVRNAPAFAILDESITLTLRIEDQGAAPGDQTQADLVVSIDGGPDLPFAIPLNQDIEIPVTLTHGGQNVLQFSTPVIDGELTDRNNAAVVQINGVRDRLRVLLVSGEPHPGQRTWRNLLKSDSSVDLVHFTILRPPNKNDNVPVDELALIAFPTRELFLEKIDEFDLIIFDRYQRRGILPSSYLDNIRGYVERGGAVLIAAGPDFAGADSLFRSPLGNVLPAGPTARVIEEGFTPELSELGQRHPVTAGLDDLFPENESGQPSWGRWFRQIEVVAAQNASTLMQGIDDSPILVLNRVGEGRVALLASDHVWLWHRGYEGGGPQLELLRRLAHWMMKEPELEEESLWAIPGDGEMTVIRQSMDPLSGDVSVEAPDGSMRSIELTETSPGRFEAIVGGAEMGLYRLTQDDQEAVVALGPAAPREFVQTIASGDELAPFIEPTAGGIFAIENGLPRLREVRAGRPATGESWMGMIPRQAFDTANISVRALVPAWLALLLVSLLTIGAWLVEGRRGQVNNR